MRRRAILFGCYCGALLLLAFAVAAASGVVFLPTGTSAKYAPPPGHWRIVSLESVWARAAGFTGFAGAAVCLLHLAQRARRTRK